MSTKLSKSFGEREGYPSIGLCLRDMKLGQIQVLHMDGCSFEAPVDVSSFEISLHFPVATSHHVSLSGLYLMCHSFHWVCFSGLKRRLLKVPPIFDLQ